MLAQALEGFKARTWKNKSLYGVTRRSEAQIRRHPTSQDPTQDMGTNTAFSFRPIQTHCASNLQAPPPVSGVARSSPASAHNTSRSEMTAPHQPSRIQHKLNDIITTYMLPSSLLSAISSVSSAFTQRARLSSQANSSDNLISSDIWFGVI